MKTHAAFEPQRFSAMIGAIYDCSIEPDLWPQTMRRMCDHLGGYSAGIFVLDYDARGGGAAGDRLVRDWGPQSEWGHRLASVFTSLKQIHRPFLGRGPAELDEPILLPRDSERASAHFGEPAIRDWAEPQGIHQVMEAVALSEPRRLGLFSVTRQIRQGEFGAGELMAMRLLAPHIRRAITISEMLDIKRLEAQALKAALDGLTTAVIIVGEHARILHTNTAADNILSGPGSLGDRRGRLYCQDPAQSRELHEAIAIARSDEAALGGRGISVALGGAKEPVLATVLPLARGEVRTRLVPSASAAVFINTGRAISRGQLEAFGQAYKLTAAEIRALTRVVAGDTIGGAAAALEIAESTFKTHLKRVFAKTGAARQSDLIALVGRALPRVRDAE